MKLRTLKTTLKYVTTSVLMYRMDGGLEDLDLRPGVCLIHTAELWKPDCFLLSLLISTRTYKLRLWYFTPYTSPSYRLLYSDTECGGSRYFLISSVMCSLLPFEISLVLKIASIWKLFLCSWYVCLPLMFTWVIRKKINLFSTWLFSRYDNHYCGLSLFQVNYSWTFLTVYPSHGSEPSYTILVTLHETCSSRSRPGFWCGTLT